MARQLSRLILTGYFHLTCPPGVFAQKVVISHEMPGVTETARFLSRIPGRQLRDRKSVF